MASSIVVTSSTSHYVKLFLTILVMAAGSIPHARVLAADSDPLQDFCVADLQAGGVILNGYPCKDPTLVTAEEFSYARLQIAANLTGNPFNGAAVGAFVDDWPALNTMGLAMARLDINPGGVVMPHTHNLATEILYVLEGEMYTGFVTNSVNPTVPNKLYAKVVKKGETYMFPRGLMHFQLNNGTTPAVSINVFNGQSPGLQLLPVAIFGTGIDHELLRNSFFMTEAQVSTLSGTFTQFSGAD